VSLVLIDRHALATPHFRYGELLKDPRVHELPVEVIGNLQRTCMLLEAVRFHLGLPLNVHSSYRSPDQNERAGGARESDHLSGSAIDFSAAAGHGMTWEANTKAAFDFARAHLGGRFGQLILEDHRSFLADPEKLWVHISLPSAKHPGTGDAASLLLSPRPGVYLPVAA
jgi:hypothetical protein